MKLSMMLLWKRHHHSSCSFFERTGGQCPHSSASLLTAISTQCLAALPAKMDAFNSHMRKNALTIVTWS